MKKNFDKEKLSMYRSMLPYGTLKLVSERSGLSRMAVYDYFSGRTCSRRAESAVLEIIAELKKEREEKLKAAGLL
jgi:hypothetical protein